MRYDLKSEPAQDRFSWCSKCLVIQWWWRASCRTSRPTMTTWKWSLPRSCCHIYTRWQRQTEKGHDEMMMKTSFWRALEQQCTLWRPLSEYRFSWNRVRHLIRSCSFIDRYETVCICIFYKYSHIQRVWFECFVIYICNTAL